MLFQDSKIYIEVTFLVLLSCKKFVNWIKQNVDKSALNNVVVAAATADDDDGGGGGNIKYQTKLTAIK